MTTTPKMLPYQREPINIYDYIDFDPDERGPYDMEQDLILQIALSVLADRFTDTHRRPDVFLGSNTNICYDRRNLNIRVMPDIYLAFGADTRAIRQRKLYLPWEVGKPPDFVLEIASESTAANDTGRKREVYARIGAGEYWRFDSTGGDYHGVPLAGEELVNGVYQPIELTHEPDGILKGYSPTLQLSPAWDDQLLNFYDPATRTYLRNLTQTREDLAETQEALVAAETRAAAAETELQRLRRQLGQ